MTSLRHWLTVSKHLTPTFVTTQELVKNEKAELLELKKPFSPIERVIE